MSETLGEIAIKSALKTQACQCLEALDVCVPYWKVFAEADTVYVFENYEGYRLKPGMEVADKLNWVESHYGHRVYAVLHGYTSFGEIYAFLIASKYVEDWANMVKAVPNQPRFYIAHAYVWNKSHEQNSEFGTVVVESFLGGLRYFG